MNSLPKTHAFFAAAIMKLQ